MRSRSSLALVLGLSVLTVACGGRPSNEARVAAPPAPATATVGGPLARAPLFTQSTHALVVGLLDFADPSLTDFATRDRRDVEVARMLTVRGVPEAQVVTYLDAGATRAVILEALARAADATPAGGTLIFYYAGHGTRTREGEIAYVAHDTVSDNAQTTGVSLSALHDVLAPRMAGKRVLFLADCCHSGGLGTLAARLGERGVTAASLTSADASNLSTGNWTYSQLLLEGLRGDPALDADTDGNVSVSELEQAVRDAMRYREHQRSGASLAALDPALVIAPREGGPRAGRAAGRFMRGEGGAVVRVEREDGTTATVRAYDYARFRDTSVSLSSLSPIVTTRYAVGAQLNVEWGGRVWPAVVTATDGDFAFITYPGWPSYWDEWILEDRVRGTR